jgi:hypothetical protein
MDELAKAAIAAVTEMECALEKFRAVIKKRRSNFEGDLIAGWGEDQIGEYANFMYDPERKLKEKLAEQKRKQKQLANPDIEPF